MPSRGGRPPKLTPEVQQRICDAVAAANTYRAACAHAGIGYSTFATWMRAGKAARSGRFRKFREAVLAARGRAELSLATQLRQVVVAENDWRGILALLSRRFPRDWAERQKMDMKLKGQVNVEATHEPDIKSAIDQLAAAYDALAAQSQSVSGDPPADRPGEPVDQGKAAAPEAEPVPGQ
jgi:transposase